MYVMSRAASSSTLGICVGRPSIVKDIKTRRKYPKICSSLSQKLLYNWSSFTVFLNSIPSIEARKEQWRIYRRDLGARDPTLVFNYLIN